MGIGSELKEFGKNFEDAVKNPGTWVAAAIAYYTGDTTGLRAFFTNVGVVAGAQAAITAFADDDGFSSLDAGTRVAVRDPVAAKKLVYGDTRVGGTIVFLDQTDDNKYLHMVVILAPHEIEGITRGAFNQDTYTIDGNNNLVFDDSDAQSQYGNYVKAKFVNGSDLSRTVPFSFRSPKWTSSHKLTGTSFVYFRFQHNNDAFPAGLPSLSFRLEGNHVVDTRTDSTAYSQNPAMCIRDYMLDETHGLGVKSTELDEASFEQAANVCDENVSLSGGGSHKRYTLDGIVDTANTPKKNLELMLTSLNGTLFYSNGKWKLHAGEYRTPTVTLDENDIVGNIAVTTAISRRDSFNAIKGKFVDASAAYPSGTGAVSVFVTADYPPITSSTFESEDNDEQRFMNLDLPYTTDPARAQRIAKQNLYKNRQQIICQVTANLKGFQLEVGDNVMITNSRFGWSSKVFEVVSWRFNHTSDRVNVDLVLKETNAGVYDWNAEETAFDADNTNLPRAGKVPAPSNLALTSTNIINNDGISIPAIIATWDVLDTGLTSHYEVQYKRLGNEDDFGEISAAATETDDFGAINVSATGTSDYGLVSQATLEPDPEYQSVFSTTERFTLAPVLNEYDYQIRVRSVNSFGARSAFVSASLRNDGDSVAPSVPTALTANGMFKSVQLTWLNPSDNDLDFVEIWENTTDSISTAERVGTIRGNTFIRGNLADDTTKYFWARAIDYSGNASAFTASVNATTLLIEPNDFNDAVNDLFQEAGAFGIEPVASLPASGAFDGQLVLLKTDVTLYRWDASSSSWSTELFTKSNVDAGTITAASFASGIEPVSIVSTLPNAAGYTGPDVVFNTGDNKIYRYTGTAFTSATNTQDLSGTLGADLFSNTLRPIERVTALPTTDLTQGRVVMLTTDNKLYRYTGNAWTSNIAASDVSGQLGSSQIADAAITETKIGDNSIATGKLQANAVTANEIATNAVTAGKIDAGAVSADKIAANAVTAAKVAADAITAGTIAAGAINASDLFVDGIIQSDAIGTGAVVTNTIAASSIIASKIGTGAVTAEKISVSELSAVSSDLGTIIVDNAHIGDVIESDNYVANTSGWKINKNGTAEFDATSIRGQLTANQINVSQLNLPSTGGTAVNVGPYYTNQQAERLVTTIGSGSGFYMGFVRITGGTNHVKSLRISIRNGTSTSNSQIYLSSLSRNLEGHIDRFYSSSDSTNIPFAFTFTGSGTVAAFIKASGDSGPDYLGSVEARFIKFGT